MKRKKIASQSLVTVLLSSIALTTPAASAPEGRERPR